MKKNQRTLFSEGFELTPKQIELQELMFENKSALKKKKVKDYYKEKRRKNK